MITVSPSLLCIHFFRWAHAVLPMLASRSWSFCLVLLRDGTTGIHCTQLYHQLCLCSTWSWTQNFIHARQEHYQLSYISILVSTRVEEVCRHRLRWEDRQHLTLDKRVGELEDARDVLKLTKNIFQHTQFCTGLGRCAGCCASWGESLCRATLF